MNDLNERIAQRLNLLGLNQADLVKATSASRGTVSMWLSGGAKPTGDRLIKAARLLGVTPEWLVTGQDPANNQPVGQLVQFVRKMNVLDLTQHSLDLISEESDDHVWVPVFDVKAACGNGYNNQQEVQVSGLRFSRQWLIDQGLPHHDGALCVIYSTDLSMWPTIEPDSVLLVDLTDTDPEHMRNGRIYVFASGPELRVKRLFIPSSRQSLQFVSDNPDKSKYPDETVTKADAFSLRFIGRVVWRGGEL